MLVLFSFNPTIPQCWDLFPWILLSYYHLERCVIIHTLTWSTITLLHLRTWSTMTLLHLLIQYTITFLQVLDRSLKVLDHIPPYETHKFGIVYAAKNQVRFISVMTQPKHYTYLSVLANNIFEYTLMLLMILSVLHITS